MKFTLFHVYTLLSVSLLGCRAVTPEVYWTSLLPNSPMPKSVKDILVSTAEWTEEKFAMVGVGAGGVEVGAGTPGEQTEVGVGRGGVAVHTTHRGKPVCVGVHPGPDPFNYLYAASADQLKDDPNVALFFLENDLHQGGEMKLHFTKVDPSQKTTFLPRNIADSIPFSSNKLPQIYNKFSIKPESPEAENRLHLKYGAHIG